MKKFLILNSKGGSGKSTIATNLAAYYACWGIKVFAADLDPQKSFEGWLKDRPKEADPIFSTKNVDFNAAEVAGAEYLVIDTPAGVRGLHLRELVRLADVIIIPVLPSILDIRATGELVYEILSGDMFDIKKQRLGVVANRVRINTRIFQSLEKFLLELEIPFLTTLRDSQNYIRAIQSGLSIFEINRRMAEKDLQQWTPLLAWLSPVSSLPPAKIINDGKFGESMNQASSE
ncbi:MAG: ParA family protein [Gammaproteobacteria bacterium]|nr:ParA family protein [Gammaproteobacteria bacterium]